MENWGGSLQAVEQGVLPTFLLADKAIPMVATRDIGTAAARLLAEGGNGKRVIELAGPRSTHRAMSLQPSSESSENRSLPSRHPRRRWHLPSWVQARTLSGLTRLTQELTHGLNADIVVWEGGHPFWRGETELQPVLSTALEVAK
jgi:uncharacterized protein YbjT (DUF2867 family)